MKTYSLLRPVLCVVAVAAVYLASADTAHAFNPVRGRWVADLPGGQVTYYHFHAATIIEPNFHQGRFFHAYIANGREIQSHGTYTVRGGVGANGVLTLRFDDGRVFSDIEHRGAGTLRLIHNGNWITYHRE